MTLGVGSFFLVCSLLFCPSSQPPAFGGRLTPPGDLAFSSGASFALLLEALGAPRGSAFQPRTQMKAKQDATTVRVCVPVLGSREEGRPRTSTGGWAGCPDTEPVLCSQQAVTRASALLCSCSDVYISGRPETQQDGDKC